MHGLTLRKGGRSDLATVLSTLEPFEPRTTHIIGWVLDRGFDRRVTRLWLVDEPNGDVAGLLVVARQSAERWCAWPYLRDPDAAPVLAPVVEASMAWWIEGPDQDVAPIRPLLHRAIHRRLKTLPHIAMAPAAPLAPPPEHAGLATAADLDELVRLYRHYELPLAGTRRGLRRVILDRLQRSLVVVARLDGRIVGALWVEVRSRHYWIATAVTVLPEYRGRGVAWDLANRALAICEAAGVGIVGVIAETNPIGPREPADAIGSWRYLTLVPPRRFRGHARLRRMWERLDAISPRTPEYVRPDA